MDDLDHLAHGAERIALLDAMQRVVVSMVAAPLMNEADCLDRQLRSAKIELPIVNLKLGEGKRMDETTGARIARVGVDLAKQVIQVHAVDASVRRVVARAFKPDQFFAWCAQLPAG